MPTRIARFASGLAVVVLAAGAVTRSQTRPAVTGRGERPKLVVLLMVDQMRADYVDRFSGHWTGGLKRLVSQGAWFRHAAYPYLTTVTCAGHSTVGTGAFPHTTGIIGNAWFDRDLKKTVTRTEDPNAPEIAYSGSATGRNSARRLEVPTFADEMRRHGAHVVTISIKARSGITMAGHGGDAVTWLSDSLDGWVTSTAFTEQPVAEVKAFVDANPIDADFGKTWTRQLPLSQYAGVDDGEGEAPPAGWTRTFPHVLNGTSGMPNQAYHAQWESSPFADAYAGRFAAALLESMRLGRQDGVIDVLTVNFASPDIVGHAFGPRSQEVQDMYAHLDLTIGTLLNRLDALVGRSQYIVGLSADHGVTTLPEQLIRDGRDAGRLRSASLVALIDSRARSAAGEAPYQPRIVGNDVYFDQGMYERLQAAPGALQWIIDGLSASPGVARVFRSEDLRAPGAATSADPLLRAAALSHFPGRSGDLTIALKPGWITNAAGATHGSASEEDQRVPVLLSGPGIKRGTYDQPITPADLAPTLAYLSGISMPSAEGRVLKEALTSAAGK